MSGIGGVRLVFNVEDDSLADAQAEMADTWEMPGFIDSIKKSYEGSPYYVVFIDTKTIVEECTR